MIKIYLQSRAIIGRHSFSTVLEEVQGGELSSAIKETLSVIGSATL
jgi:hypothetical protein